MTDEIGAPGSGMSRREFLAATGTVGAASMAGCQAPYAHRGPVTEMKGSANGATQINMNKYQPAAAPQIVDLAEQNNEVTLKSKQMRLDAHPGEQMGGPVKLPQVWAFQADDRPPSVPAPILRAEEGDDLQITLDNSDGKRPHTLHFHGVRKTWENDGVPTTTGITVGAGEKHTYDIPANVPGTHLYHCHYQTHRHIEMGMYGILRVDPKGYEPADREYFMTVKDWDSRVSRKWSGGAKNFTYDSQSRNPDTFTVNGRVAPRTLHPEDGTPLVVSQGDTVRVHLVNGGFMSHPMHIHNHRFTLVEKDGGTIPEAARHKEDVTNIAPAERHTIEFEADADPGIYLMHCHKVNHVMNGASYPGGMLTGVVYEEAMDTDIFADLMEYAGYSG